MAKFQCKLSGVIVEFTLPHDIESMRGHSGYIRLDEEKETVNEEKSIVHFTPVMAKPKQGRPRKVANG